MHTPSTDSSAPHSTDPIAALALLFEQLNGLILGKKRQIELCVVCLLAQGHLLIDDVPGVGKTTLSQGLAASLGLACGRIQFTADLMPFDLIGASIWNAAQHRFEFQPGPVFNPVVLADEINRAGPKTQSALLQAMEEGQVSVDRMTHTLPEPFFVIATQNPLDQRGTHALPESQLDRFLMCISLGYPDRQAERDMLQGQSRQHMLQNLRAVLPLPTLRLGQQAVQQVHLSHAVLDYLQNLLDATRDGSRFVYGLSPRAGLSLVRAAQAHAYLAGRAHVSPDDVMAVFPYCAIHRLQALPGSGYSTLQHIEHLLDRTEVV